MESSRYKVHLPDTVIDYREFSMIDQAEQGILEEELQAKDKLIADQWILTATKRGLERRARMMGIAETQEDTEDLRQAVLFHWNSRRPYTYRHLIEWLDGYCGREHYTATLKEEEYRFRMMLELGIKEKAAYLRQRLREILPANIITEVILNSNTHRKIGIARHARLMKGQLSFGGLPFEELRNFQDCV